MSPLTVILPMASLSNIQLTPRVSRPRQEAERIDGSGRIFLRDCWQRDAADSNAGYGVTAVMESGDLLEKVRWRQCGTPGTLPPTSDLLQVRRGQGAHLGQHVCDGWTPASQSFDRFQSPRKACCALFAKLHRLRYSAGGSSQPRSPTLEPKEPRNTLA